MRTRAARSPAPLNPAGFEPRIPCVCVFPPHNMRTCKSSTTSLSKCGYHLVCGSAGIRSDTPTPPRNPHCKVGGRSLPPKLAISRKVHRRAPKADDGVRLASASHHRPLATAAAARTPPNEVSLLTGVPRRRGTTGDTAPTDTASTTTTTTREDCAANRQARGSRLPAPG